MRIFLRLLQLASPLKAWIALAILLGAATVGSGIGLMAASAYLISAAALHPSIADLGVAIVGVRFFGLARGIFRYLERYVSHDANFRLMTRLRVWFYEALEPLAPARLLDASSGDLLARAVGDIETLQELVVRVLAPPAVSLLVGLGMAVWLASFDVRLALALISGWLLAGLVIPFTVRLLSREPARQLAAGRASLAAAMVEGVQGLPDLLAFGQGRRFSAVLAEAADSYARTEMRTARISIAQTALGNLIAQLTVAAVLCVAIPLVNGGQIGGVYLAVVALATAASFEAVLPLGQSAQSLESSLASARRLFTLVDSPPAVREPVQPAALPADVTLTVSDLSFSYSPEGPLVLSHVTFTARPGARIAVVGPSGAGKTTLVNLVHRFYDFDRGDIQLGGISLRDLAGEDVRAAVGAISQRTYLFNTTLRENLLLAKPGAADRDLRRAVTAAQLEPFISSLPRGYETFVGEQGAALSGGERQRVAIARATLRDTPILILDEPTANLDPETERAFFQALLSATSDRTLLLVTHRLVEMEAMDEILVLDHGRIVERGKHAELVRGGGLYARLWAIQNLVLTTYIAPEDFGLSAPHSCAAARP